MLDDVDNVVERENHHDFDNGNNLEEKEVSIANVTNSSSPDSSKKAILSPVNKNLVGNEVSAFEENDSPISSKKLSIHSEMKVESEKEIFSRKISLLDNVNSS